MQLFRLVESFALETFLRGKITLMYLEVLSLCQFSESLTASFQIAGWWAVVLKDVPGFLKLIKNIEIIQLFFTVALVRDCKILCWSYLRKQILISISQSEGKTII